MRAGNRPDRKPRAPQGVGSRHRSEGVQRRRGNQWREEAAVAQDAKWRLLQEHLPDLQRLGAFSIRQGACIDEPTGDGDLA